MISVQEAHQLIRNTTKVGSIITLHLYEAYGYANANDIFSPIDFPSFKQSAMDGYAFRFDDWNKENELLVEQEIEAGSIVECSNLKVGEVVRIFTGAKVPDDADTVVMQEHVERIGNRIKIINLNLVKGSNVRTIASQTQEGACILKKGTVINAGVAGLLAGLGISKVEVYEKPTCIILTTGKELIKPGNHLLEGQIYESNSYALSAGLKQMNMDVKHIISVDDNEEEIKKSIANALVQCDVLLITGGVSVGDYDFVSKALDNNGVERVFHSVKQKPGKPLYFGKKKASTSNDKIIFGLPGNPGSVLTCFYEYVMPFLKMKMGYDETDALNIRLPILNEIHKKTGLTHYLKGKIQGNGVEVLDHQESYKMNGFAAADCLIVINEEVSEMRKGEIVTVHLIK